MGSYLDGIQQIAYRLPLESVTNLLITGFHERELLEDLQPSSIMAFDNKSIDLVIRAVIRAVSVYFVFPRVSNVFASMNGCIGGTHLLIGVIQRFKTTENRIEGKAKWNEIENNLQKGFAHLLTAGYDFGIGYMLRQKHLALAGIAAAIAFAILPSYAKLYHDKIFQAPQKKEEPPKVEKELVVDTEKQETKLVEVKEEPKKEYLDPACWISEISKRLTNEILPDTEPPAREVEQPTILNRLTGTLRRVTGYGIVAKPATEAKPAQGTSENPQDK